MISPPDRTYIKISMEDLDRVSEKMMRNVVDEQLATINTACLAIAMAIQKPDITPDQLYLAVRTCSEWIAEYLDVMNNPIPKEKIN